MISTVASTYYTLTALDMQHEIYLRTQESWKNNVEVTRKLMEAGQYTQAALSQTEANYYSICSSVVGIENEIASVQNTLCSLLGVIPQTVSRSRFDEWSAPEMTQVGVPVSVLAARPDVKQAEESLAAAFYSSNAARSAFYPSITISGSVNFYKMLWSALASMAQPIFQRGTLTANLKTAEAQQKGAESTFRQTLVDAGIEVNNACREITSARQKSDFCTLQVASLKRAVESTELLMQHGSTTYLEVLTARQSLLSAEIEQVSDKLSEISATITLYQAVGGGAE